MYNNEIKKRAIDLRKNHRRSLNEIMKELSMAKSTLSLWLRNYPLTNKEQIERRIVNINHSFKRYRNYLKKIKERVIKQALFEFKKNENDPFFMLGLGIYMGEGGKTRNIKLNNTDEYILKIFKSWIEKYFKNLDYIFRGRLLLASWQNEKKCKSYWNSLFPDINWGKSFISKKTKMKPLKQNNGILTLSVVSKNRRSIQYRLEIIKTWINCAHNVK